jgi:hypothetical protein
MDYSAPFARCRAGLRKSYLYRKSFDFSTYRRIMRELENSHQYRKRGEVRTRELALLRKKLAPIRKIGPSSEREVVPSPKTTLEGHAKVAPIRKSCSAGAQNSHQ